jgi:hypothetical protein
LSAALGVGVAFAFRGNGKPAQAQSSAAIAPSKAESPSQPVEPVPTPTTTKTLEDPFEQLKLRAEEQSLITELERIGPSRLGRALGEILVSGYHSERLIGELGVNMEELAAPRLALLEADPTATLRLVREGLKTSSLEAPEFAYARGTLFALAARFPDRRREANDLAFVELTTRKIAQGPVIDAAAMRNMSAEQLSALASRPDIAAAALAHSVLVDTAADEEAALRGTLAVLSAQESRALQKRVLDQLLASYPSLQPRVESLLNELTPPRAEPPPAE